MNKYTKSVIVALLFFLPNQNQCLPSTILMKKALTAINNLNEDQFALVVTPLFGLIFFDKLVDLFMYTLPYQTDNEHHHQGNTSS